MPPREPMLVDDGRPETGNSSPAARETATNGIAPNEPNDAESVIAADGDLDVRTELQQYDDHHGEYERMMDFFPLDEKELTLVLGRGCETFSAPSSQPHRFPTFATIFGKESRHHVGDGDGDGKNDGPLSRNPLSDINKEEQEEDDMFRKRLTWAEEEFLPEVACIFQTALDNVVLIGSGETPEYKFLEAVVTLLGRRGSRGLVRIMFQVITTRSTDSKSTSARADDLVDFVYRLIVASHYLKTGVPTDRQQHPQSWAVSLSERATGMVSEPNALSVGLDQGISLSDWTSWVDSVAPQVYQALSTFCHTAIFGPRHPFRSNSPALSLPQLMVERQGALWTVPYHSVPASLAILSTNLGGPWVPLYSSNVDGCSFRALQEAVLSYQGPTVILVQTTAGDAFGYYSDCPWKESKQWYGKDEGGESFLFGLKPALQYYGIEGEKAFLKFLHNPVYQHPGRLYGMAMGGINDETPRLHITTSFEKCKAGIMDCVYGSGPLLSDGGFFFDVDVVEAFAVNSTAKEFEQAVKEGKAKADIREGTRIKAAQVDRKQFLEDFQTGQYINNGFAHRDQVRGMASFVAHDDPKRGYFVDSKQPSETFLDIQDDGSVDNVRIEQEDKLD